MKKIQKYRLGVQLLSLVLTATAFFSNFRAAMLVIMGLTLLSGVFYCGWICPYGFLQDISGKLGRLIGIEKKKMPITLQKVLVFSRYIIFGLVFLIGTDLVFNIMSFDPRINFGKLLVGNVVIFSAIGVMSFFVLLALFFERPFCNYFCYEGAKYGLISSLRLFTIKRKESTCVNCKKCDRACPMNIEVSKCSNLRSPQCINCFQCISNCPIDGTLNYGKVNLTKGEKKTYFAILATVFVLITAFIVYNTLNGTTPLNFKDKHHAEASASVTTINETLSSTSNDATVITGQGAENLGDAAGIPDGVYPGKGEGFKGTMSVQVTIKDQQIVAVEVINHNDDIKWFNRANGVMPGRIIDTQKTDVNLVSGATYSSIGIRDGVKDALEKAK